MSNLTETWGTKMTTHPEDAMTRERAIAAMADAMMASDNTEPHQRRAYYVALAAVGYDAALASAQQEPAPSADAEEELQKAWESHWHEKPRQVHRPDFEAGWRAALRRYAGDGGVTDAEWPYEVWQAGASKWHELDLEAKRLNSVIGTRVDMLKLIWAAMKDAAARAKPSEKGGAK